MPTVWGRLGELFTGASWKISQGQRTSCHKLHPAPQISDYLNHWRLVAAQQDTGTGVSWVTELGRDNLHVYHLSLGAEVSIKTNYLAVVVKVQEEQRIEISVAVQAMSV